MDIGYIKTKSHRAPDYFFYKKGKMLPTVTFDDFYKFAYIISTAVAAYKIFKAVTEPSTESPVAQNEQSTTTTTSSTITTTVATGRTGFR